MKYIRTTDGIYETTKENDIAFMVKGNRGYEISKLKDRVLKQADTIKELCDAIAYINNDKIKVYPTYSVAPEEDYKYNDAIYGCILTKEGLIFKAKMKGVLPNGEIDWELL